MKIIQFLSVILALSALTVRAESPVIEASAPQISFLSAPEAEPTADLVRVTTPNNASEISGFRPKLGTFTYQAGWQGIPAAEAKIEVEGDGLHYFINVSTRTYSAIDVFYRLRYEASGIISAHDFTPVKSVYDHKENSRVKMTEISYLESGEVRSYRKRDEKEPEVLQFNPDNFMTDPFSTAFIARGIRWKQGDVKYFDVFNGKSRYLVTLEAVEKTTLSVNGVMKNVWVISPKADNLTSRKQNKKLKSARIYVTDDEDREVLKIASSVFIGEVTATLISYEAPTLPGETTVASNRREYFFN